MRVLKYILIDSLYIGLLLVILLFNPGVVDGRANILMDVAIGGILVFTEILIIIYYLLGLFFNFYRATTHVFIFWFLCVIANAASILFIYDGALSLRYYFFVLGFSFFFGIIYSRFIKSNIQIEQ